MRIQIKTKFDCTRTNITGRWRPDKSSIDEMTWNFQRNQQRNLETLLQTVGMRTQLVVVTDPVHEDGVWSFEIEPDRADAFGDDLSALFDDCQGVPMLTGLQENGVESRTLDVNGDQQNIWFTILETQETE